MSLDITSFMGVFFMAWVARFAITRYCRDPAPWLILSYFAVLIVAIIELFSTTGGTK
jgi:hypothetical protein